MLVESAQNHCDSLMTLSEASLQKCGGALSHHHSESTRDLLCGQGALFLCCVQVPLTRATLCLG